MQTIALHRKSTIQDIARALDINAATVSRSLNNHPAISARTKQAVLKTAKKLHYQPNRIAASLRSGKSSILGVIIPSAEINFFGSVLHGIEKVANENGYTVIIYQSNESAAFEEKGIETLLRSRVDGVLMSIAKQTTTFLHIEELKKRNVPLILFDRANDLLSVPSVVINDFKAALDATSHMILQGYKRIAYITGQEHVAIWQHRLAGYKAALARHSIKLNNSYILHGDVSVQSGYACTETLLSLPNPPDAICCVEDFTALGAIQAIKARGLQVPADVGVIGFANEAFGEYLTPSLSTVDQQTVLMGQEAARLYFERTHEKNFYDQPPQKKILEPRLIIRQSSLKEKN